MNVALLNQFLAKMPPHAEIINHHCDEFKRIASKIVFSENSVIASVDAMLFIFTPEWKLVTSVQKSDLKIVSQEHVDGFNMYASFIKLLDL